jgi:hypothetical protein
METQNLWPDFLTEDVKGPKAILLEQAAYLAEKTNGLLSADVSTNKYKTRVTHTLCVVAPMLDNYRYGLFSVEHPAIYYPATVVWEGSGAWEPSKGFKEVVNNSEELVEALRLILNHPDTVKVLSSLLSQSLAERSLVS